MSPHNKTRRKYLYQYKTVINSYSSNFINIKSLYNYNYSKFIFFINITAIRFTNFHIFAMSECTARMTKIHDGTSASYLHIHI